MLLSDEVLDQARQYGYEKLTLTTMNLAGAYQDLKSSNSTPMCVQLPLVYIHTM